MCVCVCQSMIVTLLVWLSLSLLLLLLSLALFSSNFTAADSLWYVSTHNNCTFTDALPLLVFVVSLLFKQIQLACVYFLSFCPRRPSPFDSFMFFFIVYKWISIQIFLWNFSSVYWKKLKMAIAWFLSSQIGATIFGGLMILQTDCKWLISAYICTIVRFIIFFRSYLPLPTRLPKLRMNITIGPMKWIILTGICSSQDLWRSIQLTICLHSSAVSAMAAITFTSTFSISFFSSFQCGASLFRCFCRWLSSIQFACRNFCFQWHSHIFGSCARVLVYFSSLLNFSSRHRHC